MYHGAETFTIGTIPPDMLVNGTRVMFSELVGCAEGSGKGTVGPAVMVEFVAEIGPTETDARRNVLVPVTKIALEFAVG